MQLTHITISNLLSYPYRPKLSKAEGIRFYNREESNVNILIGPNGAGKSWFLHILHQVFKIGLMHDYVYDKRYIWKDISEYKKTISLSPQYTSWLHPHFSSPQKKSQVLIDLSLTEHDYENMHYIIKHRKIFNALIKKYSNLDIFYPDMSHEDVHNIPTLFSLHCSFDHKKKTIVVDDKCLSPHGKFVLLCSQTLELLQICIDIYNEFERKKTDTPLVPLKNGVAFISNNRSLNHMPNIIDPHSRNKLIADKNSSYHHSHLWFYLCVKKIWNIMSKHWSVTMTKKEIANYPQRLKESEFFTSLVFIIKKYFNKTLTVEYRDNHLEFYLVDVFGNYIPFSQLSDGEQSFLSMVFIMYGYDLRHGMVIIDEPEIHFHPQMQRSFARMIEKINHNIGTQFIVSTYSPLFINESNISGVYRFSKIHGKTHLTNPVFTLSADESSLVHLLKFENLSKIFFVNKIIMVEWETDAYFFEFYLRYLHTLPEWKSKIKDYEVININGKWSYKLWRKFLGKFWLESYFLGDWDNVVDYWFMTQNDLNYYYKQSKSYYSSLKKNKKTHRHYNRLVDTLRNLFPQKYRQLIAHIDELYSKNVFVLKKWDIETYLGMTDKWLDKMVRFCHHHFAQWIQDKRFDASRKEFAAIFDGIFAVKWVE